MKKLFLLGGLATLFLFTAATVQASQAKWLGSGNKTVVVDDTILLQKPTSFSTKDLKENPVDMPVQFFNREPGYNPHIVLKTQTYRTGLSGKTAFQYAKGVKKQYEKHGVVFDRIERKLINGRHVAVLQGRSLNEDKLFMLGVWRNSDTGYILECTSQQKDFAEFMPEFKSAIETARIIRN